VSDAIHNRPIDILVVDDSDDLRVYCTLLERAGYQTQSVKSGAECLRVVAENPPELILLDLTLPDMNVSDVCRQIKNGEKSAGVLVLNISTMNTSSVNAIQGLESGADGYITKPIDERTLLAHVGALMRIKRTEETLKRRELEVLEAHEQLENKVAQRTAELMAANTFLREEIAERRRVEEALVALTTEWEQTFNAVPEHVCIMDLQGLILRANKAMRDKFEPIHGNLVGVDYRLCYFGTTTPDPPPWWKVFSGGPPTLVETTFPKLEGSYAVASYPLFNGKGEQWGALSAVRDITEQKRIKAALHEAEQKYRDIFENAIEGIFQSTPDGRFISANPALARMLGFDSPEQLISDRRDIEQEHYVDPKQRRIFRKLLDEKGFVREFELQAYRKDGTTIWTSENTRAVRDESGTLLYYEGIVEDITRRKAVEVERLELLRRLVTAQEDEQRRISRELHDHTGQSLAALLLGLKSVQDKTCDEQVKQQILRLQDITSRIAGEMHSLIRELRPTTLDDLGLHTALSNYIDEWSDRYSIAVDFHSNGLLNARLDSQLESTIYRIVQEALNNVVKHAQAQSVSVILEKRGNSVSVIVEDDGIGFDVEALMKTPASAHRFGLLGMRERVMLVGGTLHIESTRGVGTTVLVNIDTLREISEAR
jgi:PAS domain S-box-containing protein